MFSPKKLGKTVQDIAKSTGKTVGNIKNSFDQGYAEGLASKDKSNESTSKGTIPTENIAQSEESKIENDSDELIQQSKTTSIGSTWQETVTNQPTSEIDPSSKEKPNYFIAALLAMFLGALGVHKFYTNKKEQGFLHVIFLVFSLIVLAVAKSALPFGLACFFPCIEAIFYLLYKNTDGLTNALGYSAHMPNSAVPVKNWGTIVVAGFFALIFLTTAFIPVEANTSKESLKSETSQQGLSTTSTKTKAESASPAPDPKPKEPVKTTVKYVNVGQGDASIIELPDGKTMVIDAGPSGSASTISTILKADNRQKIDYLIATHPDADHIGGMSDLIKDTDVKSIWAPNATNNTEAFKTLLETIQNKGLAITPAKAGTTIAKTDDYSIEILWPKKDAKFDDTNSYSVIIKLTVGKKIFLFTGDAPIDAINEAVTGPVDVLKVSHHGSDTGTNAALAKKLHPKVAIISYAINNNYGHPMQSVLDALNEAGSIVWGTGADGTITVTCNGTNIEVTGEKNDTVVAPKKEEPPEEPSKEEPSQAGTQGVQSVPSAPAASDHSQDIVYVTPKGKKYHRRDCRTLSRSKTVIEMTREEAEASGRDSCNVCNP